MSKKGKREKVGGIRVISGGSFNRQRSWHPRDARSAAQDAWRRKHITNEVETNEINRRYRYDIPVSPCTSPSSESSLSTTVPTAVSIMFVVGSLIRLCSEARHRWRRLLNAIETSEMERTHTTYHLTLVHHHFQDIRCLWYTTSSPSSLLLFTLI